MEGKIRPVLSSAAERLQQYDALLAREGISISLQQRISRLSRGVIIKHPGDILVKVMEVGYRKILVTMEDITSRLVELHDGMSHRGLASVHYHFALWFWIPAVGKVIHRHILACRTCQILSKNNKLKAP